MNLYQKLLEIQKRVIGLGKDKKSFGYDYVTGTKVLEYIKPIMNELGIILKQEILSIENTRQDYKAKSGEKSEIHSKVMMRFTWIDCETGDKDENLFGANGQNDFEKGLGSALTYGERYFFLKFFHLSTDEDDIDNPDRKPEKSQNKASHQEQQPKQPSTPPKQESAPEPITEAENQEILQLLESPFVPTLFREQTIKVLDTWTSADAQATIKKLKSRIKEREQEPVTSEQKEQLIVLLKELNHQTSIHNTQVKRVNDLKNQAQFYELKKEYEKISKAQKAA